MNDVKRANMLILFIFIINILGSFTYSYLYHALNFKTSIYSSVLIPQVLFILLPVLIYLIITKAKLKSILRLNPITVYEFFTVIVFSIFILPLIAFINALSTLFIKNHITDVLQETLHIPMIIGLSLIALLPAINEELLTRGILFHSYRKVHILKAALLSSLLFGMMHMNINQFIYAFVLGFVFVLLVEATNSIYPAILSHFVINGINFIIFTLYSDTVQTVETAEVLANESIGILIIGVIFIFIVALIATPIAFFLFYCLAKYNDRIAHIKHIFRAQESQEAANNKIMTWHIYACIIIFIGFSLFIELL